jgi:hypothetical protein
MWRRIKILDILYTYNKRFKIKIMPNKDMTLTSVKIKSDLFENFKIECVKRKFSFQKLADRAIYLYLTDEDFRKQISNQNNLEL